MDNVKFTFYLIKKKVGIESIIGLGNFSLKTTGDLAEAILKATPKIKFGLAMNEASDKIVRAEGNDEALKKLAIDTALKVGAGHAFFIFFSGAFPVQILPAIKNIPTVCQIFVATGNDPLVVFIAEAAKSRAIIGVGDGPVVDCIENNNQRKQRYEKLKSIGILK